MARTAQNTYARPEANRWSRPNGWDLLAFLLVLGVILALGYGANTMVVRYHFGDVTPISLNPSHLPYYALRSLLRMLIALVLSLLATFLFGTLAAKSRSAERVIIPLIDILQSVPVLGYLSITIVYFITLFRGSLLGPECAAIFAIFTAQVWNMILSFYQSVLTVPNEMREAAAMFQLNAWQRFWRIEVPFAMPGLIWNMMMSMSGSWVFLVASEAIQVSNQQVTLPGIGAYLDLALQQQDVAALWWVLLAVLLVIALYDQLIFRPLVAWAEKFQMETTQDEVYPESWLLDVFQRTAMFKSIGAMVARCADRVVNTSWVRVPNLVPTQNLSGRALSQRWMSFVWTGLLVVLVLYFSYVAYGFLAKNITLPMVWHVVYLSCLTTCRIAAVIVVSSIVWVPIGVWIGQNAKAAAIVQPIAQFLAAFPINLLFPVAAMLILHFNLNVNIWCSPLMIMGTQWYILFNVIAGAMMMPKNLRFAVGTLNVTGWLKWRKLILPAIFPYYITGAITAAGGAWNITIIAEAIQWGKQQLNAEGVGAYITAASDHGNFPQLALGIIVMSAFVVVINRLVWRPLYRLAQSRYQIM